MQVALDTAKSGGASYADVRVAARRQQNVNVRDHIVQGVNDVDTFGMGVRTLVDGAWGFAATSVLMKDAVASIARAAVEQAKANRASQLRPVVLAPTPGNQVGEWKSPITSDPFTVAIGDKVAVLLAATDAALKVKGIRTANAGMFFLREEKSLMTSDGSYIVQTIYRTSPTLSVTAVSSDFSDFQSVDSNDIAPMGLGYEHVLNSKLAERAPQYAEWAVQKLTAKPVEPGNLVASGYVVARRRATVAAEITGRVAEVLVEEGMVVQKGQLLARLDDTLASTDYATANSRIESASAAVTSTRAQLADAERIQKRTADLAAAHLVSEADVTKADTQAADLKAQLARSEAELTTARSDAKHQLEVLGKHRIVAPFAGVVVDKNAQPGEIISPMSAGGGFTRTGICTLVDMDSLEIEVDVNEAYISRVKPEQSVTATLDAYPDWSIPARVIAIVPTANREKATVRVRIAIVSKDPRILPDMAVKVSMSAAKAG